ncbi:MAG: COX15/CtaA family protein [Thermomicrobiales bacterium]
MEKAVRRLAVVATCGMFLVLIMGSTVTNTGSAEGCGRSWPLCHGEFIPSYAFETAVEYSHRLVTSIEGVLIASVAIGALRLRRGNREVKVLVALMVGTLLLQSGLGASAVMWPQQPTVKATHFGVSLVCFASVFLLTRLLYETPNQRTRPPSAPPSERDKLFRLSPSALPPWHRRTTWAVLLFVIGVAYLGAYMRHSGAEMACATWPSCNGEWFPGFDGATGIAFGHRLAALISALLVAGLAFASYRRRYEVPALYRVNLAALILIFLQALAGAAVVFSRLDVWTTLLHAGLMALLFVCLADACRQVLPPARATDPARVTLTTAPATTR